MCRNELQVTSESSDLDEYVIYSHDENGQRQEFLITNIDNFLESQENLGEILFNLEKRASYQKDLRYGIEKNLIIYNDGYNREDQLEYYQKAFEGNLKVIRKIREYLGMNPEPEIKPSILTTEFNKRKAILN